MRKRDYKAEYARRNQKAKDKGFRGYSHVRKVQQRKHRVFRDIVEKLSASSPWLDYLENVEDEEDIFDTQEAFYEWFRAEYGKAFKA